MLSIVKVYYFDDATGDGKSATHRPTDETRNYATLSVPRIATTAELRLDVVKKLRLSGEEAAKYCLLLRDMSGEQPVVTLQDDARPLEQMDGQETLQLLFADLSRLIQSTGKKGKKKSMKGRILRRSGSTLGGLRSGKSEDLSMTETSFLVSVQRSGLHFGLLDKRCAHKEGWRSRWFVLTQDKLWYCKQQTADRNITYIPLPSTAEVRCLGDKVTFELDIKTRSYYFRARSPGEAEEWVAAIRGRHEDIVDPLADADRILSEQEQLGQRLDEDMLDNCHSLMGVLETPAMRSSFQAYLKAQYCEENLQFWLEAEAYRLAHPGTYKDGSEELGLDSLDPSNHFDVLTALDLPARLDVVVMQDRSSAGDGGSSGGGGGGGGVGGGSGSSSDAFHVDDEDDEEDDEDGEEAGGGADGSGSGDAGDCDSEAGLAALVASVEAKHESMSSWALNIYQLFLKKWAEMEISVPVDMRRRVEAELRTAVTPNLFVPLQHSVLKTLARDQFGKFRRSSTFARTLAAVPALTASDAFRAAAPAEPASKAPRAGAVSRPTSSDATDAIIGRKLRSARLSCVELPVATRATIIGRTMSASLSMPMSASRTPVNLLRGWMMHRLGSAGKWTKRWVILSSAGTLTLYEKEEAEAESASQVIVLADVEVLRSALRFGNAMEIRPAGSDAVFLLPEEGTAARVNSWLDAASKFCPPAAVDKSVRVLYEGELRKRGRLNGSYRTRHFALLSSGQLLYYERDGWLFRQKGDIALVPPDRIKFKHKPGNRQFDLITSRRTYKLQASDCEAAETWMAAVDDYLKEAMAAIEEARLTAEASSD